MSRPFVYLLVISGLVGLLGCGDSQAGDEDAGSSLSNQFFIPELVAGELVDGKRIYNLYVAPGRVEFFEGRMTDTLGINGDLLGPTLLLTNGDDVELNVTNGLDEGTTMHWHGLHLPAVMDGTPHQMIEPGGTWTAAFQVRNDASTFWYHPHVDGKSGEQVYRGLAGMLIVRDSRSGQLGLPNDYGVDDIPLIIQDRRFDVDGSLLYMDQASDFIGMKGSHILVNGRRESTLETHAQIIRFRVLNGSNARFYNLGFHDNREFYQIGSDGGLLEAPVAVSRLRLGPAERAEIVVDLSGDQGAEIALLSYSEEFDLPPNIADDLDQSTFTILSMTVGAPTAEAVTTIPDSLVTIERITEDQALRTRLFQLDFDQAAMKMTINGKSMAMDRVDEVITLGDTEIWELTNITPLAHPFHIHDGRFQVLSRDGVAPAASEAGWKDTVVVNPSEVVRIIKKFEDYADPVVPYMYHCHLLEHEDGGMMGQFIVVAP